MLYLKSSHTLHIVTISDHNQSSDWTFLILMATSWDWKILGQSNALKARLDNRSVISTKEAVILESPTPEPADQPRSAKLPEKLKDSLVTISKVLASGFSSDKSAFQAVSTLSNSKQSSVKPVFMSEAVSTHSVHKSSVASDTTRASSASVGASLPLGSSSGSGTISSFVGSLATSLGVVFGSSTYSSSASF